jgi:hypothetical protein
MVVQKRYARKFTYGSLEVYDKISYDIFPNTISAFSSKAKNLCQIRHYYQNFNYTWRLEARRYFTHLWLGEVAEFAVSVVLTAAAAAAAVVSCHL